MEINDYKLISKIIISVIIIFLICMLGNEIAYNKMLYKDYSDIYNKLMATEEKYNKLSNLYLQSIKINK